MKTSPYAYVGNNPMRYTDPYGLTKEDRQRYYDYYNGKLYAYLWVLGAMGSTVGEEMANEMVKEIKTIDNKCMFIENHEQDSEV